MQSPWFRARGPFRRNDFSWQSGLLREDEYLSKWSHEWPFNIILEKKSNISIGYKINFISIQCNNCLCWGLSGAMLYFQWKPNLFCVQTWESQSLFKYKVHCILHFKRTIKSIDYWEYGRNRASSYFNNLVIFNLERF